MQRCQLRLVLFLAKVQKPDDQSRLQFYVCVYVYVCLYVLVYYFVGTCENVLCAAVCSGTV
jgi:hypothetical protein